MTFNEWFNIYREEEGIKFDTTDEVVREYSRDGWNAALESYKKALKEKFYSEGAEGLDPSDLEQVSMDLKEVS